MLTDVQIINNGLSKIAASRVTRIDPPKTPLEGFMANGYEQWKRSELTKRRWVFAHTKNYALTKTDTLEGVEKPYKYPLPNDCLRPIRTKYSEWEQRGQFLYSALSELKIDYIRNAEESEFDPLFNDVLSARVAVESVEYVTQSNTKVERAEKAYKMAVAEAGRANAFVIGAEDIQDDDEDFSWVSSRYA